MTAVNFCHAFQRWNKLTEGEADLCSKLTPPIRSWEALDHLCGLTVEAGLKALMIQARWVAAEINGDYPRDTTGRRPHVNDLWGVFMSHASGRSGNGWASRLGGASGAASPFVAWCVDHRYASDGTVSETTVKARLGIAKQLKRIAQEEGIL